jgi:hypothetical protein
MNSQLTNLKIGEYYWVTCAEIMMPQPDGRIYYIPVFDHLHVDPQFGFPNQHYHIDGRFEMEPRMRHQFQLKDGHTSAVIVPDVISAYSFLSIAVQKIRCERLETGLCIPQEPTEKQRAKIDQYENWYKGFVGKFCAGRKCPHLGTTMLEKNGFLVCPMHELTADPVTLKVMEKAQLISRIAYL